MCRAEIVRWVSESLRPFNIVNDRGFQSLMKTGRPSYALPSPTTVSRDVKLVFAKTRERIARMLGTYEGRLSFGTDAWTSPNHRAYIAITVHLEKEGRPFSMILDVIEVARSHSGTNLAEAFGAVMTEFGIENKMMSITCDNASANDAMIEELGYLLEDFGGQRARTRCFAHIINLVVKTIMRLFDAPRGKADAALSAAENELHDLAEDLEVETEEEVDGVDGQVGDDNVEGWVDECCGMSETERVELEESVLPMKLVLVKVSNSSARLANQN
jgi:hypothetical protein